MVAENAMHPESPALRRMLAAKVGDPGARVVVRAQPAPRPMALPSGDYGDRETWRRILAAHVQPLPGAAD
jgi:hypothetical protein